MSRKLLSPPVFEGDEEKTRAAELLNTVLISLTLLGILALVAITLGQTAPPTTYIIIAVYVLLIVLLQIPMRLGYIKLVGFLAILFLTITVSLSLISGGSIRAPAVIFYIVTIIMAGLIIGRRAANWTTAVNTIIFYGILWLEANGRLPEPNFTVNIQQVIVFAIGAALAALLLGIALQRLNESLEKARLGEENLSILNAELEQRVNDRTRDLEKANQQTSRRAAQLQTIADLSQTIAKVQNPNEIFPTAAKLISERFGFYHVGVFLVDSHNESAILQAANSEGGQRMLERGHRLKLGTGVVGFTAESGKPRIALDVGADAIFFNNPDLPETRSEVALPLISGEKTIGVLDVQSTESGAFTEDDLQVLSTLANQVAIALENARLLSEARASATQVQEVYNEFVRTEWGRMAKNAEQPGFRYNTGRIEMLEEPLHNSTVASAIQTGKVAESQPNGSDEKRSMVAIPVKLRGEVIGVLQVESADPSKAWLENELTLMEAVAERAALAMENARLFQDARRRATKEKMISEATSRISGSLNIENILQTTATELERVLGGSEVLIQFKSKESL